MIECSRLLSGRARGFVKWSVKDGVILMIAAFIALGAQRACAAEPDIVLADFEGADYKGWQSTGDAFGTGPAQGTLPQQKPVTGFLGHGLVNTFLGGDKATGTLTSPEFTISRKFITFLIGGGGHEGKTCMNLLVDGKIARTATGPNTEHGGSEALTGASWEVGAFAGKKARIEIVDSATGTWGHINIDQIVLTDSTPAKVERGAAGADQRRDAAATLGEAGEADTADGEVLYNGIQLPKRWPPLLRDLKNRAIRPVPYLVHPPAVIPIDVGRQLFVDDFLIEKTDMARVFHRAERYEGNPILKPQTALEMNGGELPLAALFNDGVWFDPKDHLFKMWYHAGWFDGTGYATSKDGLHWERPELDVMPGTNRIMPVEGHGKRDGSAVWLDHFASDPQQRFKMFLYERPAEKFGGQVFASPDGIHWSAPTRTSMVGDNTTILYNPFRKKWVYSVRTGYDGRTRSYRECDDLFQGATWKENELVPWAGADELDLPDPSVGDKTQLYNLDAIAYESLMLGVFNIHRGPSNSVAAQEKRPKFTDLTLAYSRDGFHFSRPDHKAFLAGTRKEGDWERAYLHPAASICAVVGDRLYFYYSAFSGISPKRGSDIYAGGATGVAFLRRDGFASMEAGERAGRLTTRPVTFKGKYFFANFAASKGELRVEALDESGNAIQPFTLANCVPATGDSTRRRIAWKDGGDLSALSGRKVRFHFQLRGGALYAFWVSPDESGASYGYVGAGGPEFDGPIDSVGGLPGVK